jgi:hypothetical protein
MRSGACRGGRQRQRSNDIGTDGSYGVDARTLGRDDGVERRERFAETG